MRGYYIVKDSPRARARADSTIIVDLGLGLYSLFFIGLIPALVLHARGQVTGVVRGHARSGSWHHGDTGATVTSRAPARHPATPAVGPRRARQLHPLGLSLPSAGPGGLLRNLFGGEPPERAGFHARGPCTWREAFSALRSPGRSAYHTGKLSADIARRPWGGGSDLPCAAGLMRLRVRRGGDVAPAGGHPSLGTAGCCAIHYACGQWQVGWIDACRAYPGRPLVRKLSARGVIPGKACVSRHRDLLIRGQGPDFAAWVMDQSTAERPRPLLA